MDRFLSRLGRGIALASALLPFTGLIAPGGPLARALLLLAACLLIWGGLLSR